MTKGQGWHGDSKGHAEAAKGKSPAEKSGNSKNSAKKSGWQGDSKGHAKAAKGESKDDDGLMSKIFGD